MRILVTGGAGFIGSHLVAELRRRNHSVCVLDSFVEQVHGARSSNLPSDVDLIEGRLSEPEKLARALDGADAVFHQAAEVGVGQSMYQIKRYVSANTFDTAVLLEALVERRDRIRKLVVASSMSIYGEGAYACEECGGVQPQRRTRAQLEKRDWELHCPLCGKHVRPRSTDESKILDPTSVYAVTKQDQEQLCLTVGRAYDIPTVALRYFNVYGAGQALSNPYTGVAAIFSSRLLNGEAPIVYEDGGQTRDFVHVSDVVSANLLALDTSAADYLAVNIGTGVGTPIARVAQLLAAGLDVQIAPTVEGKFREGDIRHCVADISRAGALLGYEPCVALETGLPALAEWIRGQSAFDRSLHAADELQSRGLLH